MESMPAHAGPPKTIHALLGRRDEPTDGVADFCDFLGRALASRNFHLQTEQVRWFERGWPRALAWLDSQSKNWRGEWVLLQYTALAWSRRGFPVGALRAARVLHRNGARLGVIFHDAVGFEVARLRDRARLRIQYMIMRNLYHRSERSVLTVPPESVEWLPADRARIAFIPIGANIPEFLGERAGTATASGAVPTIAVFSITGGPAGATEIQDIAFAVRRARERLGAVRLEVFGRGAEMNGPGLQQALEGSGVALRLRGILPAEEIARTLAASDVLLFVRGLAASRRGTFVSGIACGMPILGFGEAGVDTAMDAAGVRLVPWHDTERFAETLTQILSDGDLRQELCRRSVSAQKEYYSWDKIAGRYVEALGLQDNARFAKAQ
jgi:glycosyltransferase involved in cell wall biosynthesis